MRIMIADDKSWLRSALRLLLEHEGNFEVVGEVESVDLLPSAISRDQPDVLVLNWQLPGISTSSARRQLTATLHEIHPQLLIVALADDHTGKSSLLQGADAYVNLAEPPDRILPTLKQAAAQQMSIHPLIVPPFLQGTYPLM